MSVLIKNGRIVTAVDDYRADIFIGDETVTLIGRDLVIDADTVIDASGRLVIPGGIDPHTHIEMPFGGTVTSDSFETGTRAAAYGGTTCIVDFAIQPKGTSTLDALDSWHTKAAGRTAIDYAFHMIITDLPASRVPEMRRLADEGVTSYKMFMAYPGVMLSDDATIFRALRKAGEDGTLVCMHAENGVVIDELVRIALERGEISPKHHALTRPTRLEAEGAHRALAIAEVARAPIYIVHLSCYDALHELRLAQARGVMAHGETCPQYLLLDVDAYDAPGFDGAKYVLTPPLRESWNHAELWRCLAIRRARRHLHRPLPVLHEGAEGDRPGRLQQDSQRRAGGREPHEPHLSQRRERGPDQPEPVRRADLRPRPRRSSACSRKKGTIAVGSDADIVIFDPEREETISVHNPRTHHMNVDYSAYEGFRVKGFTETVLSRRQGGHRSRRVRGSRGRRRLRQAGSVWRGSRMSGNGSGDGRTDASPPLHHQVAQGGRARDEERLRGAGREQTSGASWRCTSTTRCASSSPASSTWRTDRAPTLLVP